MSGTINLTRKLLEMELRRELESVRLPVVSQIRLRSLAIREVDLLANHLLPFIENQIRLAKEGQR